MFTIKINFTALIILLYGKEVELDQYDIFGADPDTDIREQENYNI